MLLFQRRRCMYDSHSCSSSSFSFDGGADLNQFRDPITASARAINGRGSLCTVPPRYQRPRPYLARLPRRCLRHRRRTLLHQTHRKTGSLLFFLFLYLVNHSISRSLAFFSQADLQAQDPVVHDNGVTYMFIQHTNVYLMIATRHNCNAASLLFFLHRIVDVRNDVVLFSFKPFQI